jgi:hypothetical protein
MKGNGCAGSMASGDRTGKTRARKISSRCVLSAAFSAERVTTVMPSRSSSFLRATHAAC